MTARVYHVLVHLNRRRYLIDDARDRARFLELFAERLGRDGARIHAYCLMTNHAHLVVREGRVPLGPALAEACDAFARHKRAGRGEDEPVFDGPPRAVLVEEGAHLVDVVRYVHANPVRAGVTTIPEASDWTSHRGYLGLEPAPAWLDPAPVLRLLDDDLDAARDAFGRAARQSAGEGHRDELERGVDGSGVVGGAGFVARHRPR